VLFVLHSSEPERKRKLNRKQRHLIKKKIKKELASNEVSGGVFEAFLELQ